ncbi:hypothetical protein COV61_04405 [Candidatus Micrarchaeota archaeon CG11_big_fil_rev_8_21_14_0_20_47_5]|nr:MAG: hypothetical protein COV61_04405 [Candidatus Micrarchaeota archaeon CG11_big_fil_rev_8_21_14_0_20_47_5]
MIIVLGLPGSGKSTVLSLLQDKSCKRLNYGSLMFEIAQKEFGISSRDEIRKLTAEKQKKVQAKVGEMLANEKGKVLLDTHCSVSTPSGYLPGLPN